MRQAPENSWGHALQKVGNTPFELKIGELSKKVLATCSTENVCSSTVALALGWHQRWSSTGLGLFRLTKRKTFSIDEHSSDHSYLNLSVCVQLHFDMNSNDSKTDIADKFREQPIGSPLIQIEIAHLND